MMKKVLFAVLAMGLLAAPAFAAETENAASDYPTEMGDVVLLHGNTECAIENGIFTVRIGALDTDDQDLYWTSQYGDTGDASFVELITETTMEEGLAYAGSFRATDDCGEGIVEDYIRLVHTNGFYADEYMEFNLLIENGKIVENTGGSQSFGATEDLAQQLAGVWEEKDGSRVIEISPSDDKGVNIVISTASGRDGTSVFYTMTAYFDCIQEALVYRNGTEHTAAITDGSETEAPEEVQQGEGTGIFGFVPDEENEEIANIVWRDDTFGNTETGVFVKVE